jgi:hypothetical protein
MSLKELVLEAVERIALPIDEFRQKYAPGSIEAAPIEVGYSVGEVSKEMHRQVAKWGVQQHVSYTPDGVMTNYEWWAAKAKAFCDQKADGGTVSWLDILMEEVFEAAEEAEKGDRAKLRMELVQIAAVATSWIESIDRNDH